MTPRKNRDASLLLALVGVLTGCLALAVRPVEANEAKADWRVAMADFTADDGLIASAEGAAQWSLLTQADLSAEEPNLQWIERAQLQLAAEELHLSAGGCTSAAGSLRAGRWLKADLAILGHFTRNEHGEDGHTLRLEVVDLDHADTLAARTVSLPGDRRETIEPDAVLVQTTVAVLHDALTEARAVLAHAAGRRVIAPLFIRNADPSPRLDGFGAELIEALTRGTDHSTDLRALRFPQADRTRDEAELVVGGFTDADGQRHVADLYVWGSYRELPVAGVAFAQTPVEIDLTLWDGVRPPDHCMEHATVAELPGKLVSLADRCLDAARQVPTDRTPLPSSDATCRSVAGLLCEQGVRLATVIDGYRLQRGAFLDTPEGKKALSQSRLLLATACFFEPDDRAAQAARLRAQWGGFPMPAGRLPLLDAWSYANEVVTVAERDEAAGDATGDWRRVRLDLDAYLLQRLEEGEAELHHSQSKPNLPIDVPDATLAAWHAALDGRFARDAEAFARSAGPGLSSAHAARVEDYGGWLRTVFKETRDPAQGTRVLEALWPSYEPLYRQDSKAAERCYWQCDSLSGEVRKLYLRRNQTERGEALLASLSTGVTRARVTAAPPPAATPAADLPVLTPVVRTPRCTLPPPGPDADVAPRDTAQVATRVIHFQRPGSEINDVPRYTVHSLALDGEGTVWMSVLCEKGLTEKCTPTGESQNLVRFEPGGGTFRRVPVPGLTARPPVAAVFAAAGSLWLAQDFAGMLRYDPAAATVTRRYTVADGLVTANVDGGITDGEGRTYLVGHEHGLALVQEYDRARQEWLRVGPSPEDHVDAPAGDGPEAAPAPVSQLAACGRWLLMGLGAKWTLLDRASGQTRDLHDLWEPAPPAQAPAAGGPVRVSPDAAQRLSRAPRLCGADAGGFWLAADGKIIRLDPAHPEAAHSWPLPAELRFGVTALASDGQDLWVVGPSGKHHPPMTQPSPLAVQLPPMPGVPHFGSGFDGRGFVARLHVADEQWRGGFEVTERVGCLAVSRDKIYLGLTTASQPLIEIDKGSIQAEPQDH